MKQKTLLTAVCLILLSAIFLGGNLLYGSEVRGVTEDTIKVGVMLDMTGPGAGIAKVMLSAVRDWFRYVNDKGGVNGRMIKLFVEDDRYSAPMAIAAFKKLFFKDRVLNLIGPTSSDGASALLSQLEKFKVPMTTFTVSKKFYNPFNRYIFLTASDYDDQAAVTIDYIMKEMMPKDPRIALIYPDNTYGKAFLDGALEYLKLYGLKPVDTEVLNFGALDAFTQVLGLKRAMATHVIHQGTDGTIVALLRDMRTHRYTPHVFGHYGACTEVAIEKVPDMAPYYFGNHTFASWYENEPGMARSRDITLRYHPGTERPYRPKPHAMGWASALITTEGLKRAGRNLSDETFVEALETLKDFDTEGVIAPVTYTKISHKPNRYAAIYKADAKKGEFIRIGGWRKPLLK